MGKIYLRDNELMHWKYIKREKVNGQWVYTYEEPKKIKTNPLVSLGAGIKQAFRNVTGLSAKASYESSQQHLDTRRQEYIDSVKNESRVYNNAKKYDARKSNKMDSGYIGGVSPSTRAYNQRRSAAKALDDANKLNESLKEEFYNTPIGVLTSASNKLKSTINDLSTRGAEAVKDWLGYDEQKRYKQATSMREDAQQAHRDVVLAKRSGDDVASTVARAREERAAQNNVTAARRTEEQRKREYHNTLLGSVDRVKEAAESGRVYIDSILRRRRS